MSPLPKNTAADDASQDQGLFSNDQVQERVKEEVAESKKREKMWSEVAAAKSSKDYKALIDSSLDVPFLLELLEIDSARTSIMANTRLSPSYYYKLRKIMEKKGVDFRNLLMNFIDDEYSK
ncbi:hypothetical protein ACUVJI_23050 (plasmid) [Vibrio parahaemolyticus]|uniref:hypothetical protein n=1 Tax=Vibrio harveyi group TaxID=717610 RepID=UPI0004A4A934|nr:MULTISPECIES: hypothetical protein [Vibrio harveyi group]ELI3524306.1 hypothetical protein [Vibrio vulnificus]EGR1619138.1 hypothetical protein [Vibrio parahaemolyticus]EGR1624365.1 hypothetical protein [Vibrio parahaemolyticus]MBE3871482.1 hypothetical protein [Vibrio parahaemolyticus]MCR9684239.1 hypothetical protein [Vibrio antiquarius]